MVQKRKNMIICREKTQKTYNLQAKRLIFLKNRKQDERFCLLCIIFVNDTRTGTSPPHHLLKIRSETTG